MEQEAVVENYPIKKIIDLTGSGLVLKDIDYVPGDYSSVTKALSPKPIEGMKSFHTRKSHRKLKHQDSLVADKAALIDKLLKEMGMLTSDGKS